MNTLSHISLGSIIKNYGSNDPLQVPLPLWHDQVKNKHKTIFSSYHLRILFGLMELKVCSNRNRVDLNFILILVVQAICYPCIV